MPLYKDLNKQNQCYNAQEIEKQCLLYEGGYNIMEKAKMFLSKLSIESSRSYEERLQCASYMPYLSQFVDHFSSSLFSDDLIVREAADADDAGTLGEASSDENFYKKFASDCDGMNNSLHNFIKDTFTESLYSHCAYVGVDFQKLEEGQEAPTSMLEEESMGLSQAYLYDIDPITVIDWKKDGADDKFLWIKLRNEIVEQDDPLAEPMKVAEFKLWTMKNGVAHWALYRTNPRALNKPFQPNEDVPLVGEGDTSFQEIPVFHLSITPGLHLGNKLGPICIEYFQRRSFLVSNMNKTCISIPTVKLGPEIMGAGEAMPSEVQQNPNRAGMMRIQLANQGYTVIGKDDDVEIHEAHGYSHELVDRQLIDLREQMHQVINQMAQSAARNSQAMGRSAMSKVEDRHATEILLTAYARCVKDFVKEIYQCIAEARGEGVLWVVHGLSTFVEEDRQTIIQEVTAVAGKQPILSLIPSETAHKKYLLRLAMALVGSTSPEEEATIQEEIEQGVESGAHMPQPADPSGTPPSGQPSPAADPPEGGDDTMALGPGGQPLMPEGAHLQSGEHVDGQVVYDHLAEDYEEKDIQWVLHIPWVGPVEVPLTSIDFSNKDNWQATQEEDEVGKFAEKQQDGFSKPIVLVNNPSNDNKMEIVDGHHRALAALQNNTPVAAYVGQIGTNRGPWDKLHSKQVGKKEGSGEMQASNQMNETSIQKEASLQVSKSEKAKGGKTK